jgi:hypothetical protein
MPDESRLIVLFSGACGFVPHEDEKHMRVLLPRGPRGWQAQDGQTVVPPHSAFVKLRKAYIALDNQRDVDFLYMSQDDPVAICFLADEVLTLPKGVNQPFYAEHGTITNTATPEPSESRSLDWVAQVDAVCKHAKLKDEYLARRPAEPFAAMIDISQGILESDWVPPEVFDFHTEPPDGAYAPQCLAGQVRLTIKLPDTQAEIRTDGETDDGVKKPLRLRAIDSEIRIEISNEVLDDVILGPGFRRLKAQSDFDFEILYQLTNAPRKHWHVPSRAHRGKTEFIGVKTADCKPKRFSPANFDYPRDDS